MFCLDLETLDKRETSVVLSAAIVYFDEKKEYTYEDLLTETCFVKFNAREQIEKYKRTVCKETIQWWKKKPEMIQKVSFIPNPNEDLSAFEGIDILKSYINKHSSGEEIVWTRGSLDQFCVDSLCDSLNVPYLFNYTCYRDMRTAIDLLKETSIKGYCRLQNFDLNKVWKHDPRHDVCYDVLMLLQGT